MQRFKKAVLILCERHALKSRALFVANFVEHLFCDIGLFLHDGEKQET